MAARTEFLPLLFAAWLGSEVLYGSRVAPRGIRNIDDHVQRFGKPGVVYKIQRDGQVYYEFTGFSPDIPKWLALPSSEPAYIYSQSGQFVDWCRDPGDNSGYRAQWPHVSRTPLDAAAIRAIARNPFRTE